MGKWPAEPVIIETMFLPKSLDITSPKAIGVEQERQSEVAGLSPSPPFALLGCRLSLWLEKLEGNLENHFVHLFTLGKDPSGVIPDI